MMPGNQSGLAHHSFALAFPPLERYTGVACACKTEGVEEKANSNAWGAIYAQAKLVLNIEAGRAPLWLDQPIQASVLSHSQLSLSSFNAPPSLYPPDERQRQTSPPRDLFLLYCSKNETYRNPLALTFYPGVGTVRSTFTSHILCSPVFGQSDGRRGLLLRRTVYKHEFPPAMEVLIEPRLGSRKFWHLLSWLKLRDATMGGLRILL